MTKSALPYLEFSDDGTVLKVTGRASRVSRMTTQVYYLRTPWDIGDDPIDCTPTTRIPRSVPDSLPDYETA